MKKCKSDEILNPASNRCVKRSGAIGKKILQHCKDDEIRNPETNRCVKRSGAIGKKIIANEKSKRYSRQEGKILNPETNRWVKIDGPIGRKILEKQNATPVTKFYAGYKVKYKGKNAVVTARYGGVVKNVYEIRLNNGEIKDFVKYEDLIFLSEN